MKKIFIYLLLVVLSVSMAACNKDRLEGTYIHSDNHAGDITLIIQKDGNIELNSPIDKKRQGHFTKKGNELVLYIDERDPMPALSFKAYMAGNDIILIVYDSLGEGRDDLRLFKKQ